MPFVRWMLCAALYSLCALPVWAAPSDGTNAAWVSETRTEELSERIYWEPFMKRHDPVWTSLPTAWREGAFCGNGLLGTMIYKDEGNALRWDVGRGDVTDHREGGNPVYDKPRLGIGKWLMIPVGEIQSGTMRLDLWNAEVSGTLKTDRGEIWWRSFVHSDEHLFVIDIETSPGERNCRWKWVPDAAVNPRKLYRKMDITPEELNPAPTFEEIRDVRVCTQKLRAGGEHAVAWKEVTQAPGHNLFYLSVGASYPEPGGAAEAIRAVEEAAEMGLPKLRASHRAWWHEYYPKSFVSLPDTRLESFYWIQMYKLASATRADRMLIDNMGPWFRYTPWPGAWWNLNVQLSYWPVYASNRLELGESLCRTLDRNRANLILNVPEEYREDSAGIGRASNSDCRSDVAPDFTHYWGYELKGPGHWELCNLPWACHNYWLQYRYSMDDSLLRERLFPLMRRSINLYLHLLQEGEDGRLHLPMASSPEYPQRAPDLNIDLALLRWGCGALLESCERLGIDDPLIPRWKEVLEKLVDFPLDENGFMIGRGVPFAKSHRHFSHLLSIYPLHIVNWDQEENRDLIEKSLRHWIGFEGALQGYSFTGAASMAACMGRGDEAAAYLTEFVNRYLQPNTMYLESGPVIETPPSGANALHDLLLQSWGGTVRVFPAVPDVWRDVTVHNLRAEGAFLVSAMRRQGKTQWVRVESLAGEPLRIQPGLEGPIECLSDRKIEAKRIRDGVWELQLQRGESVILKTFGAKTDLTVLPVLPQQDRVNSFGIN